MSKKIIVAIVAIAVLAACESPTVVRDPAPDWIWGPEGPPSSGEPLPAAGDDAPQIEGLEIAKGSEAVTSYRDVADSPWLR